MRNITITGSASLYVVALIVGGTSFAGIFFFERTPFVVAACVAGMLFAVGLCAHALRTFVRSMRTHLN